MPTERKQNHPIEKPPTLQEYMAMSIPERMQLSHKIRADMNVLRMVEGMRQAAKNPPKTP